MRKKITILISIFLFFLLAMLPMQLMLKLAPESVSKNIQGVEGSVWSGEIGKIVWQGNRLESVQYSLNPLYLVTGALRLNLEFDDQLVNGDVSFDIGSDFPDTATVNDANLNLQLTSFSQYLPISGASIEGEIETRNFDLVIENKKPISGEGNISLKNIKVDYLNKKWDFGDFNWSVSTNESGIITAELLSGKNTLQLQGSLTLDQNGIAEFNGSIATNIDQTMYGALSLFNNGKLQNGRLPIKFKQKLIR
ncbi:MAG: type II secretion system protein N [Gammaproteobacteria bacterium]|nr:type II secretion system protein N [Gammaproteobacteria bacterium]